MATARLSSSPLAQPAARIERLRQQFGTLEAPDGHTGECGPLLPLGNPAIDGALGGGLGWSALHEIAAAREAEVAAASAFALALAARMTSWRRAPAAVANSWQAREDERPVSLPASGRNVIWIAEGLSLVENGTLYGPALDAIGIAPERLITVAAARERDVLWAMEEALRCRAVGMVIGEMRPRDNRSGGDPTARARGRRRQRARPHSAHRAGRWAFRCRHALDRRRGAVPRC
jgi:protein ImuA